MNIQATNQIRTNDCWDKMYPEEQEEVAMGLIQADKGIQIPHKKVMERFAKWR